MNTSSKLRVAVVGLGVGKGHVRAHLSLPDLIELAAICDIDRPKAEAFIEEMNIRPDIITDFDELCRRDDIDVIDICTPPHLHVPQSLQALAAGKHVICEKPLAPSLAEADRLAEAEAQSGKRLMPIFQYRFGHGIQKLRQLMAEGITGKPYLSTIETTWRRREAYYAVPWRGKFATELGGALVTHAIHTHDLLCYTMGPVKSVFARIKTMVNDIEVEDTASISFEMANGSLATSAITLGSSDEISRQRFCFANLTAESNRRPYTSSGDPWTFTPDSDEIGEQIEASLARFVPEPEHNPGQFTRFHHAIMTDTELPVTIADARRALELITAIYHSAETGQPVDLPLDRDHLKYNGWVSQ